MVKLAVSGAAGRMGNRILNLALKSPDFKVVAAFEHAKSEAIGKDLSRLLGLSENLNVKVSVVSESTLKGADVLIDFSSAEGTIDSLKACLRTGAALVIGTTGLSDALLKEIKGASKKIAILQSPNMSIGANFLFELARIAAQKLKEGYDIEIVEAHHKLKKDAPSGTAKKIAEVIAKTKGWDLHKVARYGREGLTGERKKDELGIHVIRAGDIVGDHTVIFSGPGETIELIHRAGSRDAFARGSLVAALFLAKKKTGLFSMPDVLEKSA